jgi:hypothetical protein
MQEKLYSATLKPIKPSVPRRASTANCPFVAEVIDDARKLAEMGFLQEVRDRKCNEEKAVFKSSKSLQKACVPVIFPPVVPPAAGRGQRPQQRRPAAIVVPIHKVQGVRDTVERHMIDRAILVGSPSSSVASIEWPSTGDASKEPVKASQRASSVDSQASTAIPSPESQSPVPPVTLPTVPSLSNNSRSPTSERLVRQPRANLSKKSLAYRTGTFRSASASPADPAPAARATSAGLRRVLYEEERAIAGLALPPGEQGTVVVSKDAESDDVIFEVLCKTATSESATVATRSLTDAELEGLYQMNVRGMPRDRASVALYAWLSDLVEIQGLDCNCHAPVHLKGYDDKLESVACLQADLRGMLDVHRDQVRSWQRWRPPAADLEQQSAEEGKRSEISAASQRVSIRAEVAEALYDYFKCVDTSGNGLIEELEFRACLLNICRLGPGDSARGEEARIHRYWCELQAQSPNHQVGFVRFTEWLVAKFPHVADMTSWQIRRFAGVCHQAGAAASTKTGHGAPPE